MRVAHATAMLGTIVAVLGPLPLSAQTSASPPSAEPDALQVPARSIPVPDTVSPEMQAIIRAPYNPLWNITPKTPDEWKAINEKFSAPTLKALPELRERLGVSVQPTTIAGVHAYIVTPKSIRSENRNRVLIHVHGGGYSLFPGEAGTREAILLAGFGGFRVVSVDYRMPPDFPYPAAVDDAMAVYRATLKTTKPGNIGVFGTSAGGGLALVMVLRAKAEHLPLPGAIAPGTPWSDLTDTGDSYRTNEYLDNFNPSYNGLLRAMALLYASGHDLKDPMLSPVYGDMQGFPPTLLNTGTRDLFLSNTVRVFRKLRDAGVDAELQVWEGQSHAEYYRDINAPETKQYEAELVHFFDRHLTNDDNS